MSSEDGKGAGLFASTTRALAWSYGVVAIRAAASFAIGIVLARILGPEPFGVVAVAGIVIGLSSLVSDFGFGSALIQAQDITNDDIRFVFTWQMSFAIILFATVAGLSGPIASLFALPEAQPAIAALASLFVINALGQTSVNLMKRKMAFKQLQIALAASVIIGFGLLGIPAALAGLGVWSLVIAQVSQGLLLNVAAFALIRHAVRPKFGLGSRADHFIRFGGSVVVANAANWTIDNLPKAFISRAFGAADLGLYSRTYTLMAAPMNMVTTGLQSVLFPAYSKAQSRLEDLKRVYAGSINAVALITLLPFAGIAAVSGTLIEVTLGAAWMDAAPILVPLAIAMPVNALLALGGPLMWGIGKVAVETRLQVLTATAMTCALVAASGVSVVAVSWSVLAIFALRFALVTSAAARALRAHPSEISKSIAGPAVLAAAVGLAAYAADQGANAAGIGPYLALLLSSMVGVLVAIGGMRMAAARLLGKDLRWLLTRSRVRLPRAVRQLMAIEELGGQP